MDNGKESDDDMMQQDDLWVFGYGSIIWKNDEVQRTDEVPAFIRGYKRRFWQRSPDHRGTHDDPGLVASIFDADEWERLGVEKDDAAEMKGLDDDEWRVHGRAFRVTPSYRDKVSLSGLENKNVAKEITFNCCVKMRRNCFLTCITYFRPDVS